MIRCARYYKIGILFLISNTAVAQFVGQPGNIDVVGTGGTGNSGYSGLNKGFVNSAKIVSYDDVDGSCFWEEKWNRAVLFLTTGNKIKLPKAKLNFYTNDIHYLNEKNEEYTLVKKLIDKIVFIDGADSSKSIGVFKRLKDPEYNNEFFEILNGGNTQLVKMVQVTLRKMDYNQYRNESRNRFIPKIKYFISNNGVLLKLSGLNKPAVLSALQITSSTEMDKWLKSEKNKLKTEKEVVRFFSFYNSTIKPN